MSPTIYSEFRRPVDRSEGLWPLAPASGRNADRERLIERAKARGRYETGPKSC